MKEFEYLVVDVLEENLQERLNDYGSAGFQLVEVKFIRRDTQNSYYKLFFMKE